ncbi:MAG: zinc-ribbon domain-containing protein [Myxococcales bacterium]|nr:zinc-ribbon domain-containing protein [Myxococcales bacterium]
MKIVCDACSAKYSIADEKVQGKVFKIRCKKCSNIIVVRGTGGADEAAAPAAAAPAPGSFDQKETRVYDYGGYEGGAPPPGADEGVWHIVVDQEQVGPLTVAEVQTRFAAGEIDGESYIWREGFADWLPLAQVPDFANLLASGSTTTAQPSSGADAVASMFGASNYEDPSAPAKGDPGDVFAAHAAKQDDDGGGDLFGQKAAEPARSSRRTGAPPDADAPLFGNEAKSAQPATVSSMKGQRNENSVLFSLGNLAALASDQPRAAAAPSSSSSSAPGTAGHGGGEGSGLIDIRSMASAYLGGAKPGMSPGGPRVGSADDLPVFSTAAFSEPAVIIPSMGGSRNNNKMLYILLGAVAFLAILAVVLVVVVLGKSDNKTPAVAANDKDEPSDKDKPSDKPDLPDPSAGTAADPGTKPADPGATLPADPGTKPADPGTKPADPVTKPADPPPTSGSSKPSSGSSKPSSGSNKPSGGSSKPSTGSSKPPPDPPPSSGGSCMGEVECMLAPKPPSCCSKYGGGKKTGGGGSTTTGGGGGDLPDSLTKSDISAGVSKVRPSAKACSAKSSAKGKVLVSVKVAGNGSVTSVTVKSTPDPALGSCVATAMKKASFTKTKSGGSFSYPVPF